MFTSEKEYLHWHSNRVQNAIEAAKPILAEFEERLRVAEVIYPKHVGKGTSYVNRPEWILAQDHCRNLQEFYRHRDTNADDRQAILEVLLGKAGKNIIVKPEITFDFGKNIHMDDNSFLNVNVTILDWAPVYIGEGTKIGANSKLYTVGHPYSPVERLDYVLATKPMKIGKRVWVGGNCTISGGVTIGDYSIIGSGAVVTKDVPSGVIVVEANKILRELTEEELGGCLDSIEELIG